jgi:hypothetical protein
MAWVYLDDQFPDHPKVVAAGDAAAWMFVCGLAYCRRYGTDGRIPKAQVPKLTGNRAPGKLAAALLAAPVGFDHGLWEDRGDHYYVHDYTKWNKPQASRSDAARTAAEARWKKNGRKAKTDADAMRDALPDASGSDEDAHASGCPPPLPTDDYKSSDYSHNADSPVDDDRRATSEVDPLVGSALAVLANRDLERRQTAPDLEPIGDTVSWMNKAYDRRLKAHSAALALLARATPDLSGEGLADLVEPPTASASPTRSSEPKAAAYDGQQAAERARAERHLRSVRGEACQACQDTGWTDDEDGNAVPCPHPTDTP